MKRIVLAVLLVACWATTASAARVYLKDGSWINAKRVWREKGTVVVLVNRDSITSFSAAEVNLRKTFPPRKKRIPAVQPAAAAAPAPASTPAASPAHAVTPPAKEGKPLTVPSLRMKLPEREPPKLGSEDGAIRKQKKEMEKRLNE